MLIPKTFAWCQIPSPEIVFIFAGIAEIDAVVLDFEHGCISLNHVFNAKSAAERKNKTLWARLPKGSDGIASRMVDMGVDGIFVANVEKPEQISMLIDSLSYPPIGRRGIGFSASNGFGQALKTDLSRGCQFPVIAMIESRSGIDNLREICGHKPAGVMVGPYDLSCSLGDIGNFESKTYREAVSEIQAVCREFRIPFGSHFVSTKSSQFALESAEHDFCVASLDVQILREGLSNLVQGGK